MGTEQSSKWRRLWVLGALAFGLYYTLAVAYFEPFHVDGIREQLVEAGIAALMWFYLPVAALLVLISIALFRLQILAHRREGRTALLLRWVVLPIGAYAVAVGLLWLYGWANAGAGADMAALGRNLLGVVALVGLLPLQLLLLTWPRRGKAAKLASATKDGSVQDPIDDTTTTAEATTGDEPIINEGNARPGQETPVSTAKFRLQPSHGESTFEILARDLILAEAADNYCKLYYLMDGQARTKMVRVTMRDVEAALSGLPGYHRCHRSFLVNAAMVEAVQGQSQAYRLKVRHVQEPVPVSRSFDIALL